MKIGCSKLFFDYGIELCRKLDKVVQRYISLKAKKINICSLSAEEADSALHELGRHYKQYLLRQLDKTIERIEKMEKVFIDDDEKFHNFERSINKNLEKVFPDIYCGVFDKLILGNETLQKIKH